MPRGGAGVMAEGAKTEAARADGGLRQSGRRRWRWRWPKAVVPRGGAAAWWGRVGSTERGLGCGWLRTRWRPVTRGRDVVIEAIAAFVGAPPAPPARPAALFAARACCSRSRATAPCQRGRGGRCHPCARVCVARVGWRAARARAWKHTCLEPGKRHRDEDGPSSSGRRADRLPLLLGRSSGTFIEFIERVELLRV